MGIAVLILIFGGTILALPLTGVISREDPDPRECAPGYSRCLDPAVEDYDCEGEGDGPEHVTGPIRVTGSDPYDLDPDGSGYGCE